MKKRNNIKFYRTTHKTGDSLAITLPKEICQQLQIKNKDKLTMTYGQDEISQYITIWKE